MSSNWWKERRSVSTYWGYIKIFEPSNYSDFIFVPGNKAFVFKKASRLIEIFETSIANSGSSSISLGEIDVRETELFLKFKTIPLCPDPDSVSENNIPVNFRTLGIVVKDNMFVEVWYLIKVNLAETGFTWTIDWAFREKTGAKTARISGSFVLGTISKTLVHPGITAFDKTADKIEEFARKVHRQNLSFIIRVWNEALMMLEAENPQDEPESIDIYKPVIKRDQPDMLD